MTEQAPDPSLPIPNDDPDCRCALDPGLARAGWDAVVFRGVTGELGVPEIVASIDPECPHHGPLARAMQRSALGAVSIGSGR